jgi:hypothetical protein
VPHSTTSVRQKELQYNLCNIDELLFTVIVVYCQGKAGPGSPELILPPFFPLLPTSILSCFPLTYVTLLKPAVLAKTFCQAYKLPSTFKDPKTLGVPAHLD